MKKSRGKELGHVTGSYRYELKQPRVLIHGFGKTDYDQTWLVTLPLVVGSGRGRNQETQ